MSAYTPASNPISIHAPHEGERLTIVANTIAIVIISIHAPHEGERQASDRAPHEGERLSFDKCSGDYSTFQSTLPSRGSDAGAGL